MPYDDTGYEQRAKDMIDDALTGANSGRRVGQALRTYFTPDKMGAMGFHTVGSLGAGIASNAIMGAIAATGAISAGVLTFGIAPVVGVTLGIIATKATSEGLYQFNTHRMKSKLKEAVESGKMDFELLLNLARKINMKCGHIETYVRRKTSWRNRFAKFSQLQSKNLANRKYQARLAGGIYQSNFKYVADHAIPGSLLEEKQYLRYHTGMLAYYATTTYGYLKECMTNAIEARETLGDTIKEVEGWIKKQVHISGQHDSCVDQHDRCYTVPFDDPVFKDFLRREHNDTYRMIFESHALARELRTGDPDAGKLDRLRLAKERYSLAKEKRRSGRTQALSEGAVASSAASANGSAATFSTQINAVDSNTRGELERAITEMQGSATAGDRAAVRGKVAAKADLKASVIAAFDAARDAARNLPKTAQTKLKAARQRWQRDEFTGDLVAELGAEVSDLSESDAAAHWIEVLGNQLGDDLAGAMGVALEGDAFSTASHGARFNACFGATLPGTGVGLALGEATTMIRNRIVNRAVKKKFQSRLVNLAQGDDRAMQAARDEMKKLFEDADPSDHLMRIAFKTKEYVKKCDKMLEGIKTRMETVRTNGGFSSCEEAYQTAYHIFLLYRNYAKYATFIGYFMISLTCLENKLVGLNIGIRPKMIIQD